MMVVWVRGRKSRKYLTEGRAELNSWECNYPFPISEFPIQLSGSRGMAAVKMMQAVFRSRECRLYIGSRLENAGCISFSIWRMQAAYWLLSGECRLYIGSCLENLGCILAHVWRMQAVY